VRLLQLVEYPPEFFFKLAHEAKERNSFQSWERRLIFNVGRYRHQGWKLSEKQENHIQRLIRQAQEEGFDVFDQFD